MNSENGEAAAKLLLILVVFTVAIAVASPWLLRSKRTEEEAKAISTLRRIHSAQRENYGAAALYGSMARLTNSKLLEPTFQDKQFAIDGYRYFHATDGTYKHFCAEAVPAEGSSGTSYGIDESGVVYEFERNTSPCYAGVLTKTGGKVAK